MLSFMKSSTSLLAILLLPASLVAAELPKEIPLWPSGAPGSEGKTEPELVTTSKSGEMSVSRIHNPSLTPYLPSKGKANGCAVLVIPGGGHRVLAITHEGYNVGEWLRERGIAAFVLKHRLARETNSTYKIEVESLADTQRAMRLIRSRASEWGVDPARLGVMGFSAGGELAWQVSARNDNGLADARDDVDKQGCKPAFQALIYPGRSGDIQPTKEVPPVFLACGYGDRKDISEGLAEVYLRFKKAGVPAELHVFAGAGHGFGLRPTNRSPAGGWPVRFEEWLADRGFLAKKP
jgi:endo-1,4-beta-xylanase